MQQQHVPNHKHTTPQKLHTPCENGRQQGYTARHASQGEGMGQGGNAVRTRQTTSSPLHRILTCSSCQPIKMLPPKSSTPYPYLQFLSTLVLRHRALPRGLLQSNRSVEHQPLRRGVLVHHEEADTLQLQQAQTEGDEQKTHTNKISAEAPRLSVETLRPWFSCFSFKNRVRHVPRSNYYDMRTTTRITGCSILQAWQLGRGRRCLVEPGHDM